MTENIPKPLESSTDLLSISNLLDKVNKSKKIELNPIYQRDIVWNDAKMSAFIDSLMRGFIPSNITVNVATNTKAWTCIDGKQRINSILQFTRNVIPWVNETEEDDTQYVYFSEIPDGRKDNRNCIAFTKRQQAAFLGKGLIVVTYKDLSYNLQCEIFNRIQNAMSSTAGEQTFSLFKSPEVATEFKQFCRNHDYTKRGRFRNVDLIMSILYMRKLKELKGLSGKKEKLAFIGELDDMNEYKRLTKIVEKPMEIFFGDELMGHQTVIEKKMTKNFILVMFYLLTAEQTKLTDMTLVHLGKVRRMLIRMWNKWNIIDGDINKERSKMSKAVLQKIEILYENNSAIMANLDGEEPTSDKADTGSNEAEDGSDDSNDNDDSNNNDDSNEEEDSDESDESGESTESDESEKSDNDESEKNQKVNKVNKTNTAKKTDTNTKPNTNIKPSINTKTNTKTDTKTDTKTIMKPVNESVRKTLETLKNSNSISKPTTNANKLNTKEKEGVKHTINTQNRTIFNKQLTNVKKITKKSTSDISSDEDTDTVDTSPRSSQRSNSESDDDSDTNTNVKNKKLMNSNIKSNIKPNNKPNTNTKDGGKINNINSKNAKNNINNKGNVKGDAKPKPK